MLLSTTTTHAFVAPQQHYTARSSVTALEATSSNDNNSKHWGPISAAAATLALAAQVAYASVLPLPQELSAPPQQYLGTYIECILCEYTTVKI